MSYPKNNREYFYRKHRHQIVLAIILHELAGHARWRSAINYLRKHRLRLGMP